MEDYGGMKSYEPIRTNPILLGDAVINVTKNNAVKNVDEHDDEHDRLLQEFAFTLGPALLELRFRAGLHRETVHDLNVVNLTGTLCETKKDQKSHKTEAGDNERCRLRSLPRFLQQHAIPKWCFGKTTAGGEAFHHRSRETRTVLLPVIQWSVAKKNIFQKSETLAYDYARRTLYK